MSEVKRVEQDVKLEGCQLIFKNFQGKEGDYNAAGNRNFGVLLPDELSRVMLEDGWNVRYLKPKADDPDQYRQPWLSVKVRFDPYPPIAQLITSSGRIKLNEETIDQLDWTMIKNCDLIVKPYNYPARGDRPAGVAAYLKAIYVTIVEDEFELKYQDLPYLED